MLRRMKLLDVEPLVMLDVYLKEIRSILELAVPAWHSGLTQKQSADIERVQRVALKIILSDKFGFSDICYDQALVILELEPLSVRREGLCINFARKALRSRHKDMFNTLSSHPNTRNRPAVYEAPSNTKRCFNSPLNYLTRLLNQN